MTKKFSQFLYDRDDQAKELVINYLKSRGYDAWVNPDQYGVDVMACKDGDVFEIEVEVKHNWKGKDFPYNSVHFSERKRKFIKESAFNIFWMLNDDWSWALLIDGLQMSEAPTIVKDTIYTTAECFIAIPVAQATLLRMK
jgi:hypothetical protein